VDLVPFWKSGGTLVDMERLTSDRLFDCPECGARVRVCQQCDRGNRLCSEACSRAVRGRRVREAGARYQRTDRGRAANTERQRRWRARRQAEGSV